MCLYCLDLETGKARMVFGENTSDASAATKQTTQTKESDFSIEEKLRRERMRLLHTGVTSYTLRRNPRTGNHVLMIPQGKQLYVQRMGIDVTPEALFPGHHIPGKDETKTNKDDDEKKSTSKKKIVFGRTDAPTVESPKLSDDGRLVTFVCDNEVYICDAVPGNPRPRQITTGARGTQHLTHGIASFIAQEEMERADGFWLSPELSLSGDSSSSSGAAKTDIVAPAVPVRYLAFEEVDNASIPIFQIAHSGSDRLGGFPPVEEHRYPFAGKTNPKARIGVVACYGPDTKKNVRWINDVQEFTFDVSSKKKEEAYLARLQWLSPHIAPNGAMVVQLQDRKQQRLVVVRIDLVEEEGSSPSHRLTVLLRESQPTAWINLHYMCVPIAPSTRRSDDEGSNEGLVFLWASERKCGQMHLYVVDAPGVGEGDADDDADVSALTEGTTWQVEGIVGLDFAKGVVYVLANASSYLERHLHAVPFSVNTPGPPLDLASTSAPRALTAVRKGFHDAIAFSSDNSCFVDQYSSRTQASVVCLCDTNDGGKVTRILHDGNVESHAIRSRMKLVPPELTTITVHEGRPTELSMAIYRPDKSKYGPGPYPCVVSVYGGPHFQGVKENWNLTNNLRAQHFRDRGFLVMKLDNRGSSRRGLDFEKWIRHDMGHVEVEDQCAGVRHLVKIGLVDPKRVAIYGWSYGGYMSAMCLCRAPGVFRAAVAGAPVTHWDGYDTHYTERYMGLPEENVRGYRESSVMHHVENMRGKLMLVHGLIDENVHFRHTARLVDALNAKQKDYELLLFPNERHQPRSVRDRVYMEKRIFEFVSRALSLPT
eukprot:g5310.t1